MHVARDTTATSTYSNNNYNTICQVRVDHELEVDGFFHQVICCPIFFCLLKWGKNNFKILTACSELNLPQSYS